MTYVYTYCTGLGARGSLRQDTDCDSQLLALPRESLVMCGVAVTERV